VRGDGLGRLPDAGEVDADHLLPLVLGELPERRRGPDAGVGDQDVELPELGDALGDRRVELLLGPDIGLDRECPLVVRLDQLDGLDVRRADPTSLARVLFRVFIRYNGY
jgi:hypothetical protein